MAAISKEILNFIKSLGVNYEVNEKNNTIKFKYKNKEIAFTITEGFLKVNGYFQHDVDKPNVSKIDDVYIIQDYEHASSIEDAYKNSKSMEIVYKYDPLFLIHGKNLKDYLTFQAFYLKGNYELKYPEFDLLKAKRDYYEHKLKDGEKETHAEYLKLLIDSDDQIKPNVFRQYLYITKHEVRKNKDGRLIILKTDKQIKSTYEDVVEKLKNQINKNKNIVAISNGIKYVYIPDPDLDDNKSTEERFKQLIEEFPEIFDKNKKEFNVEKSQTNIIYPLKVSIEKVNRVKLIKNIIEENLITENVEISSILPTVFHENLKNNQHDLYYLQISTTSNVRVCD